MDVTARGAGEACRGEERPRDRPRLVERGGVQPTYVGDLPTACAAVNLGSVAVQSCAIEAFSALLSLEDIRRTELT